MCTIEDAYDDDDTIALTISSYCIWIYLQYDWITQVSLKLWRIPRCNWTLDNFSATWYFQNKAQSIFSTCSKLFF